MNKKHILVYLLMALPLLMTSCLKDQEDFFDDSASMRTEKYLANAKRVLTSAEYGWQLNYYPDREQSYGGTVYTLKFGEEKVTVGCQLDTEKTVESTYILNNEDGPVIAFDTYNEFMHHFATPSGSSGPGGYEAYDGDFIFIIMNISEDENTITLKGNRSGNVMYMHRLTSDGSELLKKIAEVEEGMPVNFVGEQGGNPEAVKVTLSRGVATFTTEDDIQQASYIFSTDGLDFYAPITVNGEEITGIQYIEGAEQYPVKGGSSMMLTPIVPPLNEQFVNGAWFIAYSNLGTYGQTYWNYVKSGLTAIGEELYYAYLANEEGGFGLQFASYDGRSLYGGSLFFNYTLTGEDQITLQFAMAGAGDGVWYHNNANFAYALFPFGYSSSRTFTLTTDNINKPSYIILTDNDTPNNVIKLVAEEVYWPFDE